MTASDLESKIEELTNQIRIQNSVQRTFAISILRGFGAAIGATIVFGLVLALLSQVIRSIDYIPVLNSVLTSQEVVDLIQNFLQQF